MADTATPSRASFWTGWVLTGLIAAWMAFGAYTALTGAEMVKKGLAAYDFRSPILPWLGATELLCALLLMIPRTAVIGAILVSAYMGGAVATHARIGDPQWPVPIVFAVLAWVGLLLRRPELRKTMLGW